ncbi:MAG: hypothetical protein IJM81_07930 [Prevotella sp.]|nr:hypothetical protein [Prevotella sp.]
MKKILAFAACALLLTSCLDIIKFAKKIGEQKEQEDKAKNSIAATSKWDAFVIGSWKYEEQGKELSDYPRGVETFYGNGDYDNHTMDADGNKVILRGTWEVDTEKPYTFNIYLHERETAKGVEDVEQIIGCVLLSLEPESTFNYQEDEITRKAEWVE